MPSLDGIEQVGAQEQVNSSTFIESIGQLNENDSLLGSVAADIKLLDLLQWSLMGTPSNQIIYDSYINPRNTWQFSKGFKESRDVILGSLAAFKEQKTPGMLAVRGWKYHRIMLLVAARLARLVYMAPTSVPRTETEFLEFERLFGHCWHRIGSDRFPNAGYVSSTKINTGVEVKIVFRGSTSPWEILSHTQEVAHDWLGANLNIGLIKPAEGIFPAGVSKVPAGYYYRFYTLWKLIKKKIHDHPELDDVEDSSQYRFVIAGHSLGGAVATLTALAISIEFPTSPIKLFTLLDYSRTCGRREGAMWRVWWTGRKTIGWSGVRLWTPSIDWQ